jgi:hypothetical protein
LVAYRVAPQQPGMAAPPPVGSIVVAVLMYAAIAAGLVWTGIASCRCRRWCRPIVLVIAWPSLVIGAMSAVLLAVTVPTMMAAGGAAAGGGAPPMPAGFVTGMVVVTILVSLIFYVALPGLYVWVYRRPQTKLTLDALDPHPNWTDGRPLPVLGVAVWTALTAAGVLSAAAYAVVPVFGTYVTGLAAIAIVVAVAAVLLWGAWQAYHVRAAGWWVPLAFSVLAPASWIGTLATTGLRPFYELAGFPEQQIRQAEQVQGATGWAMAASAGVFAAVTVAWLVYARKFWKTEGTGNE